MSPAPSTRIIPVRVFIGLSNNLNFCLRYHWRIGGGGRSGREGEVAVLKGGVGGLISAYLFASMAEWV
jgi:hypothetical protein